MPTNMYGLDQYGSQAEDIERRRRYAEFLQTQSMEPIPTSTAGGMTGNIHWTQGLAKMLQAYQGGKGQKKASEERTALSGRMQEERSRRLAEALRLGKGTPGSPMPPRPVSSPWSPTWCRRGSGSSIVRWRNWPSSSSHLEPCVGSPDGSTMRDRV